MRKFRTDEKLKKQMNIFFKKDRNKYEVILKKMDEIVKCDNPNHYKNLRSPFQEHKEVHVANHFVLIFRYMQSKDLIIFEECCHHNDIFKW